LEFSCIIPREAFGVLKPEGISNKNLYVIDVYNTRVEAASAATVLFL